MKIEMLTKETFGSMQKELLRRSTDSYPEQEKAVASILERVRLEGDQALFAFEEQFDHCSLDAGTIRVSDREIEEAYEAVPEELVGIIRRAIERIRKFHEQQKQKSWFMTEDNGMVLGQRVTPLQRAGVYVPGGKAAYPSSVLMNVIPAQVAGVGEIIMCTPPGRDGRVTPTTLVAAKEAGVHVIFKAGGAQAVAAMAFGTESIPKVDKITGPGNIYVALAKKAVYGHVAIDSVAGPSEITVLADESADPHYVAADLLSQAEHDELASSILVTTSRELAEAVINEIEAYTKTLERREIILKSLENFGHFLVAESMEEAVAAVNEIAPEHLEIVTKEPFLMMTRIRNAGAIFVGSHSSEPLGDYFAGPNHVLPTNGTARFFSALSVDDFIKKTSIIYSSDEALEALHSDVVAFAKAESLTAHANSIQVRFGEDEHGSRAAKTKLL